MKELEQYFPDLSDDERKKFADLGPLISDWNSKINVISRRDMGNFYLHHVLHSLSIYKFIEFSPGSRILDLGTGGGFPGIPLAIMMPEVEFTLIDARAKKLKVVDSTAASLKLSNVKTLHIRAEELKGSYDFVVSRAVTSLEQLCRWSQSLISQKERNPYPNGLICLKGGNLKPELKALRKGIYVETVPISRWFREDFFEEKHLLYVQI